MNGDAYSINNTNHSPRTPVTPEEHHGLLHLAMIITCLAIILVLSYWWYMMQQPSQQSATPVVQEVDIRSQIAAILRDASIQQVSAKEVERIATQLRSTKSKITAEERANIANALRGVN